MNGTAMQHTRGTILLFMLGLITVMLVTALAFLRSMQITSGSMQSQRREELSRLAAEMGMQHAIAVCLHEYGMAGEVRDGLAVGGADVATRPDGPSKNVFNLMSPQTTPGFQQPPQKFDMAPDVPFQDLFGVWGGSTYHFFSSRVTGFSQGYTLNRGYGRWFEANRWDYDARRIYDPASYDNCDPRPSRAPDFLKAVLPVTSGVSTPFPVVDPWQAGQANLRPAGDPKHNPLDNPLFLDAEYRPVEAASRARYRLRYAVSTYDMSGALWLNTDMPWLDDSGNWPAGAEAKRRIRRQYKDVIDCVGAQMVALELFQYRIKGTYKESMESVFLGYGPQTNNQFYHATPPYLDGVPYDWQSRNRDGFDPPLPKTSQPMAYRSPHHVFGDRRKFHCVLGSPFMNGFDPTRPDGTKQWLGGAIGSFTDLGFALSDLRVGWEYYGENANDGHLGARADLLAQRAATPFGRPYDIDGHPWAVNILSAPARVLQALVSAYIPPANRRVLVTRETQVPRFQFTDGSGNVISGWATSGFTFAGRTWTTSSWTIPASAQMTIAGVGFDLFTDAFQPQGRTPFAYPTPANRDYWGSSPADRRTTLAVPDERGNAQRYPGEQFFSHANEPKANRLTRWESVAADPPQTHDDTALTASVAAPTPGVDHLGRHIIFYLPGQNPGVNNNNGYLTAHTALARNWQADFYPTTPFGVNLGMLGADGGISIYLPSTVTVYGGSPAGDPTPPNVTYRPVHAAEDFTVPPQARSMAPEGDTAAIKPETWLIQRSTGGDSTDTRTTASNSYWQRLSLAFLHAVVVTQAANLAWADPQDNRSQGNWALLGATGPFVAGYTGGPTYNPNPASTAGLTRKGPGRWDPKAADFTSLEQVDRQFLANLGESFDAPGARTPAEVVAGERPPRYLRCQLRGNGSYPGPTSFATGTNLNVAEYRVSNNIRTLLTPLDTRGGATLTASSTAPQTGANAPPRNLWLLDEYNALGEAGYVPRVEAAAGPPAETAEAGAVGDHPTRLARARAKLMERVLNDWRMNFFGAAKAYKAAFRPKDFDGDGLVFCSGYLDNAAADPDTGLACFAPVAGAGRDGPGAPQLTVFSVTGCLTFTRSHQYKIHVRGELVDNFLDKAVSENYLEGALLIDPDNNVVRGGALPTGLDDSALILQHPIHNYYRGYLARGYP